MNRRVFATALSVLALVVAPAGAEEAPKVRLQTTLGDVVLELNARRAPQTVENFLRYVQDGYYDGTIFHRVIKGFMIQGGGFTEGFDRKTTRAPIRNEADNQLKNLRGSIAMARTSDPDSATAQFFINVVDNASLNHKAKTAQGWGYAVFGKVVEGMDTVDRIRDTPTSTQGFHKDVPSTPVVILSTSLEPRATE